MAIVLFGKIEFERMLFGIRKQLSLSIAFTNDKTEINVSRAKQL